MDQNSSGEQRTLKQPRPEGCNSLNHFLAVARKQGTLVHVLLCDGTRLSGTIWGSDSFSILLKHGTEISLIYKSAVHLISKRRASLRVRPISDAVNPKSETHSESKREHS
jgi:RNA chaperone Hfq